MIIEMVAAEIGVHGCVESNSLDPVLVETVGGDFHRNCLYAEVGELAEEPLELDRAWRCKSVAAGERTSPADDDTERANRRGGRGVAIEDVPNDGNRRRL